MNERIKQLWLDGAQSLWPRPGKCTAGEYDYNLEKFAELIVQECIDIIAPYSVRMSRPGEEYLHPIQEIKEHFGVKK